MKAMPAGIAMMTGQGRPGEVGVGMELLCGFKSALERRNSGNRNKRQNITLELPSNTLLMTETCYYRINCVQFAFLEVAKRLGGNCRPVIF